MNILNVGHQLPRTFLANRSACIVEYNEIIFPPPLFGGLCSWFLTPSRSGTEYDNKLKRVTAKIINSNYMTQCVMIDQRLVTIALDADMYTEYVEKINHTAIDLEKIKTKGELSSLETARNRLLSALDETDQIIKKYMQNEDVNFLAEVTRRITLYGETLSNKNLPTKTLIKIQAGLQEVMNSGAASTDLKSKKYLLDLEDLMEEFNQAKARAVPYFENLGKEMIYLEVMNVHQNESDLLISDLEFKLNHTTKQWSSVKKNSIIRAVAVDEDDIVPVYVPTNVNHPTELLGEGASNVLKSTGKGMKEIGKGISSVPLMAADIATTGVEGVASMFESGAYKAVQLAGKGASGAGKLATKGAGQLAHVGSKVSSELSKAVGGDTPKSAKPEKKNSIGLGAIADNMKLF